MGILPAAMMPFFLLSLWPWTGTVQGAVLSGVVVDVGEPVAKAEVMLVNGKNNAILDSAYTDAEGRFRFTVKPGVFNIGTFKSDHATAWRKGIVVQDVDVSVRIELTPNAFLEESSSLSEGDCE